MIFSFGGAERERLEIDILGYEREPTGESYDDNWLSAQLSVSVGGFHGGFDLSILADELTAFLGEIRKLGSNLLGTAELKTTEEQVHMKLTGDGKGHIALEGEVVDRAGDGNRLSFALELDQTQLRESISQVDQVVRAFPVRRAEL